MSIQNQSPQKLQSQNPSQNSVFSQPQSKPRPLISRHIFIFALVMVTVLALFYASIYFSLNSKLNQITGINRPTPSPSPIISETDPTANWKIYSNNRYGYLIKYPINNTRILTVSKDQIRFLINATLEQNDSQLVYQILKEGLQIDILVTESDGKTAKELLSRHVDVQKFQDKISTQQIDGIEAWTVKFQFPDWNQFTEVVKGNKLYEFRISTKGKDQVNNLILVDQILSTFRFDGLTTGKFLNNN